MIVSEQTLSPLRSKSGGVWVRDLPKNFFTSTDEAFRSDWPDLEEWFKRGKTAKDVLEVVLVLAFTKTVPVLSPGREWLALQHQCGGINCEQLRMVATRLTPRPSIYAALRDIAREGYGISHFNRSDVLASRIANYVEALKRIGVDCECTYRELTESVYPIDAIDENLARVAEDAPNLSDLAADYRPVRFDPNTVIFFLAENSD